MENQTEYNNADSTEYNLYEIYYILRKRSTFIISAIILLLIFGMYYTIITKPQYSAKGIIMINEEQKSMNMLNMGLGKDINFIENEIQILKSRTTSDLVVEKLLLKSTLLLLAPTL